MEERKFIHEVAVRALAEKMADYELELDLCKYRNSQLEAEIERLNAENQNLANVISRMTEKPEESDADA